MSDVISREDAINEIINVFDDVLCCNVSVRKGLPEAVRRIEMMPSVDKPTGKWVDIDNYYRMATCSRCHKVTMFEKWGKYTKPYRYCPNCGARMKGGGEE